MSAGASPVEPRPSDDRGREASVPRADGGGRSGAASHADVGCREGAGEGGTAPTRALPASGGRDDAVVGRYPSASSLGGGAKPYRFGDTDTWLWRRPSGSSRGPPSALMPSPGAGDRSASSTGATACLDARPGVRYGRLPPSSLSAPVNKLSTALCHDAPRPRADAIARVCTPRTKASPHERSDYSPTVYRSAIAARPPRAQAAPHEARADDSTDAAPACTPSAVAEMPCGRASAPAWTLPTAAGCWFATSEIF